MMMLARDSTQPTKIMPCTRCVQAFTPYLHHINATHIIYIYIYNTYVYTHFIYIQHTQFARHTYIYKDLFTYSETVRTGPFQLAPRSFIPRPLNGGPLISTTGSHYIYTHT